MNDISDPNAKTAGSRRDFLGMTAAAAATLAERKKRLAAYRAYNRRTIDRDMIRSIFTRNHPGSSDLSFVEAFADAVLALDTSPDINGWLFSDGG